MYRVKKIPLPAETVSKSFLTSDVTLKNYILTYFCQKFVRDITLPVSPLLLCFTIITDHLRAGEVQTGSGL